MYQTRYAVLLTFLWLILANGNVARNEDICGPHNGRRIYLELGEKGVLYARNVSFEKNTAKRQIPRIYGSNSSHEQCRLELVTCPSCVITVTFKNLALPRHCENDGMMMDSPCRCDYVWISEPPYEDVSGTPFCGLYSPLTYRSNTRTLSVALLYSRSHKQAFTLEYTAERNRLHLRGMEMTSGVAKDLNNTGGGILTSPFFPARYPRDLGLEYVITCPTDAPSCRIRLLFSDFQLATVSIMEFYDWNGQRLDVSSGARFRPPIIVSSGSSLLMRFYANGGTGFGYKAFYSFVIGHHYDNSSQPITDCGGYVDNLGGAITMMNMVDQGVKTYDCVWLIRPPKNFLHMKTHMYLKVIDFADMAGNTELTIRQGPTSALLPLEVLRHPASQLQPLRHREHVAPVSSGFHVSFRGTFGPSSHLAIAYAAFSYMDCFTGADFLCQNHRCILSQLNCDGFDHCGDNSDEPASCFQDWKIEPQDRKWHSNKANYYFPKSDQYPDLKTATLVFIASSLGLIILISALIILLYKMSARARQQRELQSRLQTISELLDGARIDEGSVSDDPPVYEAPPGYDEVIKLGLEPEHVRRKTGRSINCERNRNSPNRRDTDSQTATCLLEGSSIGGSSQAMPISATGNRQCIPESPPPPYVTPPGTVRNYIPGLPSPESQPRKTHADFSPKKEPTGTDTDSVVPGSTEAASSRDPFPAASDIFSVDPRHPSTPKSSPGESDGQFRCAEDDDEDEDEEEGCEGSPRSPALTPDVVELTFDLCSCEGACGCANDHRNLTPAKTGNSTPDEEHRIRRPEDDSYMKSAIVKLLGTKYGRSPEVNSTASTPSRNLQGCSRETMISVVSSRGSYEKLEDEFEAVSEESGEGMTGGHSAGCYNFDLESLYEGIKTLDNFLARRALAGCKQSVAVMLCGTPEHNRRLTIPCNGSVRRNRSRVRRSSDHALTN